MNVGKAYVGIVLILALAGCATSKQNMAEREISQLQSKVRQLEWQLKQKDERISDLKDEIEITQRKSQKAKEEVVTTYPARKVQPIQEPRKNISKPTTKQIQAALKKAGFYEGSVDGKIGSKTKEAIKKFQKTHGLGVDGVVGERTWAKLERYLY